VLDSSNCLAWYLLCEHPSDLTLTTCAAVKKDLSEENKAALDADKPNEGMNTPNFYKMPPVVPEESLDVPCDVVYHTSMQITPMNDKDAVRCRFSIDQQTLQTTLLRHPKY
jgi:hypothetical protein